MEPFSEANEIELKVYDALKKVIDPEIGINIVDLGLVYKIEYQEEKGIVVEMTLSTKGCPMGDVIFANAESEIKNAIPNVKVTIDLVWEPEWKTDFVTPDGRKALGMN